MKIKFICIFFIIIIFCTSCDNTSEKNASSSIDNSDIEKSTLVDEDSLYAYNENSSQNYWGSFAGSNYIREVDNGYYFFFNDVLCYFDKNSKSSTVVCSSLNCTHDNEECSAYFGIYGDASQYGFNTMGFEIYEDYIYLIGYDISEVWDCYLYRCNLDGTGRTKIGYLYSIDADEDNGYITSYELTMHNGCLYGILDSENEYSCISKITLDGEVTKIVECNEGYYPSIDSVQCYNNYVYYIEKWYESEDYTGYNSCLYRYNINSEEIECLIEGFYYNFGYLLIDDNKVLYMNTDENFCVKDISTKDESVIIESNAEDLWSFSFDGRYIYIVSGDDSVLDVYDTEGNLIDEITDFDNCFFGDSEFLFVEASCEPESGQSCDGWSWWVLDKSQIGETDKDWIMIATTE